MKAAEAYSSMTPEQLDALRAEAAAKQAAEQADAEAAAYRAAVEASMREAQAEEARRAAAAAAEAADAAARRTRVYTRDELAGMRVRALKAVLTDRGLSSAGMSEKGELVAAVLKFQEFSAQDKGKARRLSSVD